MKYGQVDAAARAIEAACRLHDGTAANTVRRLSFFMRVGAFSLFVAAPNNYRPHDMP